MKTCTKCGVEKSLDYFHRQKSGRFGRASTCKECRVLESRKYYESNRRAIRDKQSAYRDDNSDKIRDGLKKYYAGNRQWFIARNTAVRSLRKSLPSERVTVKQVALRDGAHCWLCGDELSDFDPSHMDHLIPLAADPELLSIWGVDNPGTVLANMALACPSCNIRKSNKILPCAIARYLRNLEPIEAAA